MKNPIKVWPNPILCKNIPMATEITEDMDRCVVDLRLLMDEFSCYGLAANQIGDPYRIIIIRDQGDVTKVYFNPFIISRGHETEEDVEECLSIPNFRGPVSRSTTIRFGANRHEGDGYECDVHGHDARVIQHEIDHLDGIIFPGQMNTRQRVVSGWKRFRASLKEAHNSARSDKELRRPPKRRKGKRRK